MSILSESVLAKRLDQRGINMVDLMMWLVIAALLLAAAIQGIGYFQRAATVYQMENDVTQAANTSMASASVYGGMSRESIAEAVSSTRSSSKKITLIPAVTPWSPDELMITAKHPDISEHYIIYLFKEHAPYNVGVNLITKDALDSFVGGGGASVETAAPIFSRKPITIKINPAYCIENKTTDSSVQITSCNGSDQQDWTWNGDGGISSGASKASCIQPNASGVLKMATCDNSASQKFQYRKSNNWTVEMYFPKTDQCVERKDGTLSTIGYSLSLAACSDTDWQRWGLNVKLKTQGPFITAQAPLNPGATAATSCLDNLTGALTNGNATGIWGCNENAAQQFSWSGSGKIHLGTGETKCLDASSGAIQIWDCNSSPSQMFTARSRDGNEVSVYNPAADKCIGYTSGNTSSDMKLTFTACNTDIKQRWVYDPK